MLGPVDTVPPQALHAGQRALVQDLAWASLSGAFSGGVVLVAFALSLGATPLEVGLLAAIPFVSQAAQWPATLLIERVRRRRLIGVALLTGARLLLLAMALLPLLPSPRLALSALLVAQALVALLHAVAGCAVNSWLHQLIPPGQLGGFFARRLFWGTATACAGTLAAGALVERAPSATTAPLESYALAFVVASLAGLASSFHLARAPEPRMQEAGPRTGLLERLRAPLHDRNFRRLLVFLGAWTIAANIAVPFIAVYLMEQLGYPLGTVTRLWVVSQVANAITLLLWGRLSDRLSNKGVLAVALPLHFAAMLAMVAIDGVQDRMWQLALLHALHVAMGIAAGGIGLATGNLGLKLAPAANATAYLAAIGLTCAIGGGLAPVLAGALAQAAAQRELSGLVRWTAPGGQVELSVITFAHWDFVFAASALLGLYVMHALSRVAEGREVGERQVVQEFLLEAWHGLSLLSSVAGSLGALFPFERSAERRKWWRARPPGKPG